MTRVRTATRSAFFASSFAGFLAGLVAREEYGKLRGESDTELAQVRARFLRAWTKSQFSLFRIEATFEGAEPYFSSSGATPPGRLFIANHRSAIDILLLLHMTAGFVVSRADLANWPLLGYGARRAGTLFVDRKDPKSGAKTIRQMSEKLKRGHSICLFPEGTTFEGDEVRPFHGGAFLAAKDAGVDVVPIGIAYGEGSQAAYVGTTFVQHLGRVAASERTPVSVVVGDSVKAEGSASKLSAKLHRDVAALVVRARARVDA